MSCHLAPPPLAAPPSPLLRCELRAQAPTPRCQHKSPSTSNQLGANEELAVNLHPPPGLIKPHLRPSATATLGFPLFMKGHRHATGKFIPFKHFILRLNFKFSPLSKQFFSSFFSLHHLSVKSLTHTWIESFHEIPLICLFEKKTVSKRPSRSCALNRFHFECTSNQSYFACALALLPERQTSQNPLHIFTRSCSSETGYKFITHSHHIKWPVFTFSNKSCIQLGSILLFF